MPLHFLPRGWAPQSGASAEDATSAGTAARRLGRLGIAQGRSGI